MEKQRLLVADHPGAAIGLKQCCRRLPLEIEMAESAGHAIRLLEQRPYSVAVAGLSFVDACGEPLWRYVKVHWPKTEVIVSATREELVQGDEAIVHGAFYCLTPPYIWRNQVQRIIQLALAHGRSAFRQDDAASSPGAAMAKAPPAINGMPIAPAMETAARDITGEQPIVSLAELERRHIECALRHTQGNQAQAAQLLGINVTTLWRKRKR